MLPYTWKAYSPISVGGNNSSNIFNFSLACTLNLAGIPEHEDVLSDSDGFNFLNVPGGSQKWA